LFCIYQTIRRNIQKTDIFLLMIMFWVVVPCGFIGRCQHCGETYCPHLQGESGNAGKQRDHILYERSYTIREVEGVGKSQTRNGERGWTNRESSSRLQRGAG
jgi:hypothetical protein